MNKDHHHAKARRTDKQEREDQIEESLSAIFEDEKGRVPDLTVLERRRPRRALIVLGSAIFLGLCGVLAWAGMSLFKPFHGFTGQGLQLVVDGPRRVSLGEETTYFINWQNSSAGPLAATEIRVSFPTDFTLTKVEPPATGNGLVWRLGSLPYGARGTLAVKGIFTGALGTQTAIQVVGTYRPASFNSDFEALASLPLEYGDTVLEGMIEAPQKSLPGDKLKIVYRVHNRGSIPLKNLEARLMLPEGFVLDASSTPTGLDEGRIRMPIGELVSDASSTVSIQGTFASGRSGEALIRAEVGRVSQDGEFQPALKNELPIVVLNGDLQITLVANGSDATERSIGFGELLRFTLGYENTATEDVKGVMIRVKAEPVFAASASSSAKKISLSTVLDWKHVEDSASGTVSGNALTWNASSIGVLERLTPHTDGAIEFVLPIVASVTSTEMIGFQVVAEASMEAVGSTIVRRTVRTAPMVFRFRTDATIQAEARYFSEEGAPLGSGPLPPLVGQTTTYRIQWTVTKQLHELKNVKITAALPKNVTWPKKSSATAGEVSYDESRRLVSWTLNRLPLDVQEAQALFDVQLTPGELDAGRFVELLGETRMEATDVQINEQLIRTKPGLTTDLQNDEGAKSKGVVRKP